MKKWWLKYGILGLGILIPLIAFAADTRIQTNQLILGQKNTGNVDKTIQFDIGAGSASNPKLKWNSSINQLSFANDGSTFQSLGTGSGSGSGGINLLGGTANGNFESGTSGWTASGGTFTTVSASPNLIDGLKTGSWAPSAGSQTLSSNLQSVVSVAGLQGQNCAATALYKTAEGTNLYSWQVLDNSSNVLAGPVTLQQTTNIGTGAQQAATLSFICPTSGSIKVQFLAASSTPSNPLYVDDVTLGSNNLLNISQAQFYGAVTTPMTASCFWAGGSNGSFSNYSATSACPVATPEGNASAPATKIPGIRFPNGLPAGRYFFTVSSDFYIQNTGTGNCNWTVSDGHGNLSGNSLQSSFTSGQGLSAGAITGSFNYTTAQGDTTLQVQSQFNGTVTSCNIDASSAGNTFRFEVYYFPATTQVALNANQSGWTVDASITGGSGNNIVLTNSGSVTDVVNPGNANLVMSLNNNSISTQIPCSSTNPSTGLTCAAGTPQSGIVYNQPVAGPVRVCTNLSVNISTGAGGSVENVFQIVETPNNSDSTVIQGGKTFFEVSNLTASNNQVFPTLLCEDFTFMSAGKHTLRLFYSANPAGTVPVNQILVDNTGPGNHRNTRWIVIPLAPNITQPIILPGTIYASYYQDGAGNTTPGTGNPIVFANKDADTNSAVTSGRFTAPLAGHYNACITNNGSGTGTIFLYKNGSSNRLVTETLGAGSGGCVGITLVQGDIIDFRDNNSSTYNQGTMTFTLVK